MSAIGGDKSGQDLRAGRVRYPGGWKRGNTLLVCAQVATTALTGLTPHAQRLDGRRARIRDAHRAGRRRRPTSRGSRQRPPHRPTGDFWDWCAVEAPSDDGGAVAILVAILAVVMFGFAAIVVDLGLARSTRSDAQDSRRCRLARRSRRAVPDRRTRTPDFAAALAAVRVPRPARTSARRPGCRLGPARRRPAGVRHRLGRRQAVPARGASCSAGPANGPDQACLRGMPTERVDALLRWPLRRSRDTTSAPSAVAGIQDDVAAELRGCVFGTMSLGDGATAQPDVAAARCPWASADLPTRHRGLRAPSPWSSGQVDGRRHPRAPPDNRFDPPGPRHRPGRSPTRCSAAPGPSRVASPATDPVSLRRRGRPPRSGRLRRPGRDRRLPAAAASIVFTGTADAVRGRRQAWTRTRATLVRFENGTVDVLVDRAGGRLRIGHARQSNFGLVLGVVPVVRRDPNNRRMSYQRRRLGRNVSMKLALRGSPCNGALVAGSLALNGSVRLDVTVRR